MHTFVFFYIFSLNFVMAKDSNSKSYVHFNNLNLFFSEWKKHVTASFSVVVG